MSGINTILSHVFIVWSCNEYIVAGMNSSTAGQYFIVQVYGLQNTSVIHATAFTISTSNFTVSLTGSRFDHSLNETRGVSQYQPARFQINQTYFCHSIGMCGTLVFRGNENFALDLLNVYAYKNADAMQVIPVAGFGTHYIVMTIGYGGFVLFLSAINENTIFVRLKFNPTEALLRIPSMSSNYRDGEIMTIILDKEQAFNLMQCSYKAPRKSPDLTGTHLSGSDSFGVITGSCNNYLPNVIVCAEEKNTDYISDMALPLETYGRYFIIFERGTRTSDTRLAIVISSEPNTTIRVDQSDKYIVSMLDPGTRILLHNFPKEHYALRASKPCACYLMLPSTCGKIAFGDGSLTVVPPNELFFNIYMWSFQTETYTPDMQTYVILIVHKWYINSTQINDTFIHNKFVVSWNKVMGNNDWLVGAIQLEGGTHIAHLTSSLYKFGCYIYVSSEGFGFISSAGFILASINTDFKKCIATNGTDRYDYIDNDCDGRIDEEIKNDIDDDGDGRTDEDLGIPDFLPGIWTQWNAWECRDKCGNSSYVRYRGCKPRLEGPLEMNCPGDPYMTKDGICITGVSCNTDCPVGLYGEQCLNDCSNCENKCNSRNGSCASCKAGWAEPRFACTHECPKWTYGYKCMDLCEVKCGEDCMERVQGICPGGKLLMTILVPFIISPILGLLCLVGACTLLKNNISFLRWDDCRHSSKSGTSISIGKS